MAVNVINEYPEYVNFTMNDGTVKQYKDITNDFDKTSGFSAIGAYYDKTNSKKTDASWGGKVQYQIYTKDLPGKYRIYTGLNGYAAIILRTNYPFTVK